MQPLSSTNRSDQWFDHLPLIDPPKLFSMIWRGVYLASLVQTRIHRVQRRYEHPYLYAVGVILRGQADPEGRLVSSITKIVRTARILHESLHTLCQIHDSCTALYEAASAPISPASLGYLAAIQRNPYRHLVGRDISPAFVYTNPWASILIRRCERCFQQVQEICGLLRTLFLLTFELWQTFFEEDDRDDVLLEIMELYRLYDVSDPDSLFMQMEKTIPLMERLFQTFHIPIAPRHLFENLRAILEKIASVEQRVSLSTEALNDIWQRTYRVGLSVFPFLPRS